MYKFLIKRKAWLRSIAITLLLTITFQLFLPAAAWALTAGPTAPEFSSFEPIDTTDMVNLQTGDFTYNVPLLEVPGPEGGYPLALSYHAGINPNEEASWVGLGWSLNPGAIGRTPNFYPDDIAGATRTVHDNWNGGDRTTYSFGVGIDGIGLDVAIANDTYKGVGVGLGASQHFGYGIFNASLGMSPDPYGESYDNGYATLGASYSGKATSSGKSLSGGVGVSTNFESVSGYANAGISSSSGQYNSLLGANISDNNSGGSHINVAGAQVNQINNNAGKISTSGYGYGVTIPIYSVTINLGYSYVRYWSDERDNVNTYGSLHADLASSNFNSSANSFDSYCLVDQSSRENISGEPEHQVGGSFPAYDYYSVMGQGVGGYMQPYLFEQGSLYRQNVSSNGNIWSIQYQNKKPFTKKAQFRFKNDFSNAIERTTEGLQVNADGFNSEKNHLAGSKHIEWFTNNQIAEGAAQRDYHFIATQPIATTKYNYDVGSQVGGFMITNSSGVTYHYGQPVYAYEEYQKYTSSSDGGSYREYTNNQPYAYTWLLTAITGPDYVDMNNPGLDDSDYGYWVKFNYGQWTDSYKWRTPYVDKKTDIDRDLNYYSRGKKEIYYLDAIETRSHIALFVKDVRKDAMSVGNPEEGSLMPIYDGNVQGAYYKSYSEYPVMSLKLSEIRLYNKENLQKTGINLNTIKASGDPSAYNYNFTYDAVGWQPGPGHGDKPQPITKNIKHNPQNVIMLDDISGNAAFNSEVLRQIDFETSNVLCNKTENSISDISKIYNAAPDADNVKNARTGKLTLTKLTYLGKGGTYNIPPMIFDYGENVTGGNPDYDKDMIDMWGYYKSDLNKTLLSTNENIARLVTDVSARNVDVWSLKKITTSLGAQINIKYGSDIYDEVELAKQNSFSIKKVEYISGNKVRIYLNGNDIDTYYQVGHKFGVVLVKCYNFLDITTQLQQAQGSFQALSQRNYMYFYDEIENAYVSSVNSSESYVEVDDPAVYQQFINVHNYANNTIIALNRWPLFVATGFLYTSFIPQKGGGLKVESIAVTSDNTIRTTKYDYLNGSTSYEPFGILKSVKTIESRPDDLDDNKPLAYMDQHIRKLYCGLLFNSREIPGPGVFYGKTTVTDYVTINSVERKLLSSRQYIYDNFDVDNVSKTMFDYLQRDLSDPNAKEIQTWHNDAGVYDPATNALLVTKSKETTIKDYTTRTGILRSVIDYNQDGNKINETNYTYLHDGENNNSDINFDLKTKFYNQGLVHQSFREDKNVENVGTNLYAVSNRYDYPVILVKTVTHNITSGLQTQTENLAFDFYSGSVTKNASKDSYGNSFLTVKTPAYRKYGAMGLKVISPSNKQMLDQTTQTEVFKVKSITDNTLLGLIASTVTTWSNDIPVIGVSIGKQPSVWRQYQNYSWLGSNSNNLNTDGTYPISDYNNTNNLFDFNSKTQNSRWLKNSEVTLTDVYSHALEEKSVNGRYSAVKMDNNNKQVIVAASNANYNELFYSGAESMGIAASEGGVSKGDGSLSNSFSHTGVFSLLVDNGNKGFKVILDKTKASLTKKYIASVWVYLPNSNEISLVGINSSGDKVKNMSTATESKKAGGWYLIQRVIEPNGADITIQCQNNSSQPVYFDDFRVQPIVATSTAYVYDKSTGELSHILNNDGLYTRFVYNTDGKLARIFKEKFLVQGEVLMSVFKINYKH